MESFFCYCLEKCGRKLVFLCNLKQKDASQLKIKDPFFKEIGEYWSNSNYSENPVFQSTYACILHNSLMTIEKTTLMRLPDLLALMIS